MRYTLLVVLCTSMLVMLLSGACSGDGDKKEPDVSKDTGPVDQHGETSVDLVDLKEDVPSETIVPDTEPEQPEEVVVPKPKCLDEIEAAVALDSDKLDGPVELVIDKWGVPHVFASTEHDLFLAQGYIVARYRFVQMQGMRQIPSGLWSRILVSTPSDLSNDVYMRLLGLRRVAEKIWEGIQAGDPESKAMLEAFAEGVNLYIERVEGGAEQSPIEWAFLGKIEPWTPVDSLTIGRLQSWDLSFGGRADKLATMARFQELMERWQGTPLEGIEVDMHPLAPATDAVALPEVDRSEKRKAFLPDRLSQNPSLRRFARGYFSAVNDTVKSCDMHAKMMDSPDVGSNNWTVSAANSGEGGAMVANDTHLSLRNPAVFYEIHLNTTRAGGDIDLAGVTFPGIPSIILGRNGQVAWGATVYYADATDIYVEEMASADPPKVIRDGSEVDVVIRKETFDLRKLPGKDCDEWATSMVKGMDYELVEEGAGCKLTVDIWDVPGHGPMIPGSRTKDKEGKDIFLTWKWTGFEPSYELRSVYEFIRMKSTDDFLKALEHFEVGAQNWVYADNQGKIAYAAYCRIPVRAQLMENPIVHPPFLPVPGTGCCEWTGNVPLEKMPHSVDPDQGFIFTANGDSFGYTLDFDPFNDESYQGYMFDIGFRADRVQELIKEKLADGKLTVEDMQAIQADHQSPMGKRLVPHLLKSIQAAKDSKDEVEGSDPELAVFATAQVLEAAERLAAWSFMAANGAQEGATQAQKDDAVATSIFNAWLIFVTDEISGPIMDSPFDNQFMARFLLNLFEKPEMMLSWDDTLKDSAAWTVVAQGDPPAMGGRDYKVLTALVKALDFLSNPDVVGVPQSGGFGTSDMSKWLWGELHTVTLPHTFGGESDIPPESKLPNGFPRHSDNFCVDSADPKLGDTDFRFTSGPAIRNVFVMKPDKAVVHAVIPGGQDMKTFQPHYSDLMNLWVENKTHLIHQSVEDLLPDAESCVVIEKK